MAKDFSTAKSQLFCISFASLNLIQAENQSKKYSELTSAIRGWLSAATMISWDNSNLIQCILKQHFARLLWEKEGDKSLMLGQRLKVRCVHTVHSQKSSQAHSSKKSSSSRQIVVVWFSFSCCFFLGGGVMVVSAVFFSPKFDKCK